MCGSDLIMLGLSLSAIIVSSVTFSLWWNSKKIKKLIIVPGDQ